MSLFVGRDKELAILKDQTLKRVASLTVLRGRRRIGKSRLIDEFCKPFLSYKFMGLPPTPETTNQDQINEFLRQLCEQFGLPEIGLKDWGDVFSFLAKQLPTGRVIIVFDEISWMGSEDSNFSGKLKTIWDTQFKKNDELILIVCSSVSAWIEENIMNNTGYVGRISCTITLEELQLKYCNQFFRDYSNNISAYEKFKLLAVTGGVPRYLEEIRPEITAEQNLKKNCFTKGAFLFDEFDRIFSDIFLKHSDVYRKAVVALTEAKLSPSELANAIGVELASKISKYFNELNLAGFVSRYYTWNIKTGGVSKLSKYSMKDNYIRFYLKYILPNKHKIETGSFDDKSLSSLPGWSSIMGLQFENLVLNNRKRIWEILEIKADDIIWDNPFFQHHTSKMQSCQIDYMIQVKSKNLYICEIKFLTKEINIDIIPEIKDKIYRLKKPKGYSCRPILIHVNGVSESVVDQDYFAKIIDFGELLHN
jgi:AAA+ ATPase superfamily predicted ATPase